ncbi:MAG TPA: alpha/beta hydrolase [Pyrinomonadaceae bacterium]|nr:alpha/beta hydrolase [Pyrinomonadaceae bacterium]
MTEQLDHLESSLRHGYAQIGDVRLHYAERGTGDRLVILLHGFPECWYSWRHQLAVLGERFRVVAPDMRGYNLSDKPQRVEDYRIERLVDDVTGLVRHFGATRAAIVGHDWGAAVAWAVAQKYPEYVWKLAALQVPPGRVWAENMSVRQLLRSWYMFFFQIPKLPEWWISRNDFAGLDDAFRKSSRPGTFTDKDLAVLKAALREPGALTAALNYYRANVFSRLFKRSTGDGDGRVRVPTLFIFGERDLAILPETVRGVERYIDAPYRELRIAESNHWVQQEFPAEVNAALARFLEE